MKKFFFCAAAAIVALASCSKTQVVYNDAPQEIGFKAVTGAITKAVQTKNNFTQDMGVIAYQSGKTDVYFTNAQFEKKNDATTWNGKTPQYWPIASSLDFFVYSPYQASSDVTPTVTPTNTAESKTLQVVVADNSEKQDDYLYSTAFIIGKSKTSGNIKVNFNHALANVIVKFKGAEVITISNAKLNGTYQSGTYTVTYGNTAEVAWSNQGTETSLDLYNGQLNPQTYSESSWLVVPENDSNKVGNTISFEYHINGMEEDVTISKEIEIDAVWAAGTQYIYNVIINTNEIVFEVETVADWAGRTGENTTI